MIDLAEPLFDRLARVYLHRGRHREACDAAEEAKRLLDRERSDAGSRAASAPLMERRVRLSPMDHDTLRQERVLFPGCF
jgi:hypothetical protein